MDLIAKYLEELESLDLTRISSKTKYADEAERGIEGEIKVRDILKEYSDEFYQSVVIWNKRHEFTTEIDFLCMINGFLVLVDAKEWYGSITPLKDTKVIVKFRNASGHSRERIRTNPVYAITAFFKDLKYFLLPNQPSKDLHLKRIIVFTRDEIVVEKPLADSTAIDCKLGELEKVLKEIKTIKNEHPYKLEKKLPSWDYYLNEEDGNWYKVVVMNKTIPIEKTEVPLSEIDSILFPNDTNEALVLFKDGTRITTQIDRRAIYLSSNRASDAVAIRFLKLDKYLHDDTPGHQD